MPESTPARLELLHIQTLADELDSQACALDFLGDFLHMLPGRMARILEHLEAQDGKAAMDAILSLKVTSFMAGALDAEATCRYIEALIRQNQLHEAANAGHDLKQQVQALIAAGPDLIQAAHHELLALAS